jgi:REP element-mobilizing transposase RayT
MTAPREVVPGWTYLISRRCHARTFRLLPSKLTNAIFEFCLALAAARMGIVIHAVCVMSNHHHLVITDPRGVYPDFLQLLHVCVAKALNFVQGQSDSFWSGAQPSVIHLADPEMVLAAMAYVAANPVSAGLVRTPVEWPGVLIRGSHRRVARRPEVHFDPNGSLPETVPLVVEKPPAARLIRNWDLRLEEQIAQRIADAHRDRKGFLGRAKVLATSFLARPESPDTVGRVPRVAAVSHAALRDALEALKRFRAAYASALEEWRAGNRAAVFPAGTWWMRVHHQARVSPFTE